MIINILPPKLKNIYDYYKVMCGCECCISAKSTQPYLLSWRDHDKNIIHQNKNSQRRRSGETTSSILKHIRIM